MKIGTYCKDKHLMAQHDETRMYIVEVQLKKDVSKTVKE